MLKVSLRGVVGGHAGLAVAGLVSLALCMPPVVAEATSLYGDTTAAPRCTTSVQLMGVVYNDRKPERSFAMVSVGKGGTRMVYVGSRIEGKVIGAILPMAIWLGPADTPCWLPLAHDAPATPTKRAPRPKRKKKKKRRR